MGCVVALALLFVVFEWSVSEDDGEDLSALVTSMSFEEDIVPIAMQPLETKRKYAFNFSSVALAKWTLYMSMKIFWLI